MKNDDALRPAIVALNQRLAPAHRIRRILRRDKKRGRTVLLMTNSQGSHWFCEITLAPAFLSANGDYNDLVINKILTCYEILNTTRKTTDGHY